MKNRKILVSIIITAALIFSGLLVFIFYKSNLNPKIDITPNGNENVSESEIEDSIPANKNTKVKVNVSGGVSDLKQASNDDIAEKPEIKTISFLAAGDNIIHSSVYEDAKLLAKGTDKEYNFVPMYDHVRSFIENADISFVNQETLTAGTQFAYSGYPTFNSPDEAGTAIVDIGFDIVNIANNHMLDKGEKGLLRTIEFWKKQPVMLIGGYLNKEDYENIRILEYQGLKIALLSYTYGTNGLVLPSSSNLVIPYYDYNVVDRQTKAARKMADLVFVSMHWGNEDNYTPNSEQERLRKLLVNNCVDVVIGHHPHVIQPIKWYDRPDGEKTLVAYSIGNMLSTMLYSRNMVGGFLTFDIERIEKLPPKISNVQFIPTITHYNSRRRGLKVYQFSEYTEELEKTHGAHANDPNMSISSMKRIITSTIGKEFLKDPYYN